MLMLVPQSYAITGVGNRWDNIGAMMNRGVEIAIDGECDSYQRFHLESERKRFLQ